MNEIIRLVKISFDNMENRDSRREEEIGIFAAGDGKTAYGKISDWFREQPPVSQYTGYDGQVYPQWRLEKKYVR